MEQAYEILRLFYKFKQSKNVVVPIGDTPIIQNFIQNCEVEKIFNIEEQIYCPKCGDTRKHKFSLQFDNYASTGYYSEKYHQSILNKCKEDEDAPFDDDEFRNYFYKNLVKIKRTILITGRCLQCDNEVVIIIYNDNNEINMVKLYECGGGVTTEHTPESVKYYLDEAYKCKIMGAYTGAVAMYRTALENLLYDKGYHNGMLREKIEAFEKHKASGLAPRWADVVDGDILDRIRGLGNWAVHPNKGDITRQQHFQDEKLIECLDDIFKYLLDEIYEKEVKRNMLLEALNKKSKDLVKNR